MSTTDTSTDATATFVSSLIQAGVGMGWYAVSGFISSNIAWPYKWMKELILYVPGWVTVIFFWVAVPFTFLNIILGLLDIAPLWNFLWEDGDTSFIDAWIDLQAWWVWLI
jgi:hypothetical protein